MEDDIGGLKEDDYLEMGGGQEPRMTDDGNRSSPLALGGDTEIGLPIMEDTVETGEVPDSREALTRTVSGMAVPSEGLTTGQGRVAKLNLTTDDLGLEVVGDSDVVEHLESHGNLVECRTLSNERVQRTDGHDEVVPVVNITPNLSVEAAATPGTSMERSENYESTADKQLVLQPFISNVVVDQRADQSDSPVTDDPPTPTPEVTHASEGGQDPPPEIHHLTNLPPSQPPTRPRRCRYQRGVCSTHGAGIPRRRYWEPTVLTTTSDEGGMSTRTVRRYYYACDRDLIRQPRISSFLVRPSGPDDNNVGGGTQDDANLRLGDDNLSTPTEGQMKSAGHGLELV